jgi:hypothetical protein
MLIEFSVANFRSFQEMQTLRLQAAPIKSKDLRLDEHNIFKVTDRLSLLKSKVIFGPNASGKSNLVKALFAFMQIFRGSLQDQNTLKTFVQPFVLDNQSLQKPTFFQIQFRTGGRHYRYGFEANQSVIVSEWLYSSDGIRPESYYFKREGANIEVNPRSFKEAARLIAGKGQLPPLYRPNTLFLPLVAAFNGPTAVSIVRYFNEHYAIYSGIEDATANAIAMGAFHDEVMRAKMAEVLKHADVGIEKLEAVEVVEAGIVDVPNENLQKQQPGQRSEGHNTLIAIIKRKALDEKGNAVSEVPFLMLDESYGTQKLFMLSPFLIDALEKGGILVIDEFGSSLHVKLIQAILDLFHSPATNPRNAQLIVATHDTHLLDQHLFRRDQFAFVEKTRSGQSILIDLVEFKGVRNDASLESDYLKGRFGAVPFINQFDWPFIPENHGKATEQNEKN